MDLVSPSYRGSGDTIYSCSVILCEYREVSLLGRFWSTEFAMKGRLFVYSSAQFIPISNSPFYHYKVLQMTLLQMSEWDSFISVI